MFICVAYFVSVQIYIYLTFHSIFVLLSLLIFQFICEQYKITIAYRINFVCERKDRLILLFLRGINYWLAAYHLWETACKMIYDAIVYAQKFYRGVSTTKQTSTRVCATTTTITESLYIFEIVNNNAKTRLHLALAFKRYFIYLFIENQVYVLNIQQCGVKKKLH